MIGSLMAVLLSSASALLVGGRAGCAMRIRSTPKMQSLSFGYESEADFRHGTGDRVVRPMGGVNGVNATGVVRSVMPASGWSNPTDEFRHGHGGNAVVSMPGW